MTDKPAKPAARAKRAAAAPPPEPTKRAAAGKRTAAAAAAAAEPAKPARRGKRTTVAPAAEPAKRATAPRAARVKPATPPPTSRAPRTDWRTPSHGEICERAYFIALEEGGGDEVANWLRAERELATALPCVLESRWTAAIKTWRGRGERDAGGARAAVSADCQ